MNNLFKLPMVILMILSVFLTACATDASTQQVEISPQETQIPANDLAATSDMTTQVPTATEAKPTTATIDVEALILEKLAGNHGIDRVYRAVKTREEWNATLDRMIGYGAQINEEEKQLIIDYLVNRQP